MRIPRLTTLTDDDARHAALDPERWIGLYGDAMFRYAYARLRDRALAEDAVQECLLAALSARDSYRGDSSEKSWLFGILKHKILDQFRRDARQVHIGDDADTDAIIERNFDPAGRWLNSPGEWQNPAGKVENSQFWTMLEHCIDALPKTLSVAIRLIEIDEVNSEEACKALGISATNLWVRLHRARLGLRECVQRSWFSDPSTRSKAK